MAAANYKDIMNIDISSVAISLMQEKYKDHPALTCKYDIENYNNQTINGIRLPASKHYL